MRGLALLLALAGCPAEQLGVRLPEKGVGAVRMDDLVRDVRGLSAPSASARAVFFAERLGQMGLEPDADGRCARRPGPDPVGVATLDEPTALAIAISLAKSVHGRGLGRGLVVCRGEVSGGAAIRVGAVGRAPPAWRVRAARPEVPGAELAPALDVEVEVDGISSEDPDLRLVEATTRALVPSLERLLGVSAP